MKRADSWRVCLDRLEQIGREHEIIKRTVNDHEQRIRILEHRTHKAGTATRRGR